jgi:hypothetical protein
VYEASFNKSALAMVHHLLQRWCQFVRQDLGEELTQIVNKRNRLNVFDGDDLGGLG